VNAFAVAIFSRLTLPTRRRSVPAEALVVTHLTNERSRRVWFELRGSSVENDYQGLSKTIAFETKAFSDRVYLNPDSSASVAKSSLRYSE